MEMQARSNATHVQALTMCSGFDREDLGMGMVAEEGFVQLPPLR